jgi:nitrite reductase/ring-hydroxylating ferredoxin subunit
LPYKDVSWFSYHDPSIDAGAAAKEAGMRPTPLVLPEPAIVVDVGDVREVLHAGRAVVHLGPHDTPVLIIRTRKGIFAIESRCPHAGHPLTDGTARRTSIRCSRHRLEYDLVSGACRTRRNSRPAMTYRAWLDSDGHVRVAVPDEVR